VAWWEANMGALRRLQALENEGLEATADEQWGLKGYSGFGGAEFAEDFNLDTDSSAWVRRGDDLREMLSEDEYNAVTGPARLLDFLLAPD